MEVDRETGIGIERACWQREKGSEWTVGTGEMGSLYGGEAR